MKRPDYGVAPFGDSSWACFHSFHLAFAALRAISERRSALSLDALARPPTTPPLRARSVSFGFVGFAGSSGVPSRRSPITCSRTEQAWTAKS